MTALCGTMPDAMVERPLYDEAERRWQIGYGAPTNLCSRAGLALLAETVRARVLRRLPSAFRFSIRGGAARTRVQSFRTGRTRRAASHPHHRSSLQPVM